MRDNKLEKLRSREKIFLIIGCVFLGQAGSNFDFGQYVTAIVFFVIWIACTVGVFITSSKITHREFELERPTGYWKKCNDTLNCSNCGFGYFPTNHSCFINKELQYGFSKFNYCPMCGSYMGSYDLSFTDEERLQIKYK